MIEVPGIFAIGGYVLGLAVGFGMGWLARESHW